MLRILGSVFPLRYTWSVPRSNLLKAKLRKFNEIEESVVWNRGCRYLSGCLRPFPSPSATQVPFPDGKTTTIGKPARDSSTRHNLSGRALLIPNWRLQMKRNSILFFVFVLG